MFTSNSPADTAALGARMERHAKVGDVYALTGDLGAGKTQFVQGFVAGVGSEAAVTSPTFTLVHEYGGGRVPVYHFDFYRLENAQAVMALGFDDYVYGDGVCLVEWADRFRELLPETARWIAFRAEGETIRHVEGVDP